MGYGARTSYPLVKQLRAEYEGIRGRVKPGRPLGTWPETSSKVLWTPPPPQQSSHGFPTPDCCLGIQRTCKHWGHEHKRLH